MYKISVIHKISLFILPIHFNLQYLMNRVLEFFLLLQIVVL